MPPRSWDASTLLGYLAYSLLSARTGGFRDRRISAMVRVKNEEEFLDPAVRSIAGCVDEIVLIDNLSTDRTPAIIDSLRKDYPAKLLAIRYPHHVVRLGAESWNLSARPGGRRSLSLSANFYNWCLRRCTGPYVLKWDGDMVATERFYKALEVWRSGTKQILVLQGANVHPDMEHLVAARCSDRDHLLRTFAIRGLPKWATTLSNDYPEPRLFPKLFARYTSRLRWTQELSSPFLGRPMESRCVESVEVVAYLHLKFCKREPLATYSRGLKEAIASNITVGSPLSSDLKQSLHRWGAYQNQESSARPPGTERSPTRAQTAPGEDAS